MLQVRSYEGDILNKPKLAVERYAEILRNGKVLYLYPIVELSGSHGKRLNIELTDIKIESNEDRLNIESVVLYRTANCTILYPNIHAKSPKARFKEAFHTIICSAITLTLLNYNVYIPTGNMEPFVPIVQVGSVIGPLAQQQMKAVRAPLANIHRAKGLNMTLFDPDQTKNLAIDCVAFLPGVEQTE